jgi:hypothetical protein
MAGGEHNTTERLNVKYVSVGGFVPPNIICRPSQAQASLSLASRTFNLQYSYTLSIHHCTRHATARQLPCNSLINASSGRKTEHSGGALDHFVIDRVSNFCGEDVDKEWGEENNRTKLAVLFFKFSKSATSKRSSLPLVGSLRSDGPPFL